MSYDGTLAIIGTIFGLVGGGIFYGGHREAQQAKKILQLPYTSFEDLEKLVRKLKPDTST